jgi:hypothetical protein
MAGPACGATAACSIVQAGCYTYMHLYTQTNQPQQCQDVQISLEQA